ncbi:MAG: hypothetical protein IPL46_10280 [Saprospiraceae bacterium]|nr:hypothetical protein [Saprospiraceae bacterium]
MKQSLILDFILVGDCVRISGWVYVKIFNPVVVENGPSRSYALILDVTIFKFDDLSSGIDNSAIK